MNRFKKSIFALSLLFVVGGSITALAVISPVSAKTPITIGADADKVCSQNFLTFPTWFRGLVEIKDVNGAPECVIKSPDAVKDGLSNFIWHIVLNVIEIGLQLVVYLTVFFIILGGFQFLTSQGVPEATVKARKTILNAAIGLVISIVAIAAVNLVFSIIK